MPIRFAGRGIFNSDKRLAHLSFIDDSYEWLDALWNTVTVKVGKRNTLASLMCVICRQQRLKTMHAIRQAEEQRSADAACGAESQAQQPMPLMQDRGQLQRSHYDDVLDGQHCTGLLPLHPVHFLQTSNLNQPLRYGSALREKSKLTTLQQTSMAEMEKSDCLPLTNL